MAERTIRALAVDPSNLVPGGDPLGTSLLDGMAGTIHVRGARQYEGTAYPSFSEVENDIAATYNRAGADALIIEANSMGRRMAHAFQHEHHLRVVPINTVHGSGSRGMSARPKGSPDILRTNVNSMDKMEHANWLVKMQNEGDILWPETMDSDGMRELRRQWSIFGEYHKDRLEAPPNDHDDLIMSLFVGTYWLRHTIVESAYTGGHVMGGVDTITPLMQRGGRPDYKYDSDVIEQFSTPEGR